jgi:hypothetical protein
MKRPMRYPMLPLYLIPLLWALPATSQEFQPYSSTLITDEQWQIYFFKVQRAEGIDAQRLDAQHLMVFTNSTKTANWIFTQMGHPAHPSWIARRVVADGDKASIQQIGYFVREEQTFANFFEQYLEMNKKIGREPESGERR